MRKITFNPNRLNLKKPGEALYFAYSSDMDIQRMDMHCPHPKGACIGTLQDHCIVTDGEGYITLQPKPGAHIQGIVWKISADDQAALDRRYGVAEGFRTKITVRVDTGIEANPRVEALAYVSEHGPFGGESTCRVHMQRALRAAMKHQLDQETLEQLGNLEIHESMVSQIPHKDYVCDACFRKIEDCICDIAPGWLLNIDEGIQDVVRILNDKGYPTRFSCTGHGGKEGPSIMFQSKPCDLEDCELPSDLGIYFDRRWNSVKCTPAPFETDREIGPWQQERLDALLDWAENLPVNQKALERRAKHRPEEDRNAACRSHLRRSKDAYKQYRCMTCHQLAEECTCERGPSWHLFLIDPEMLPFKEALREHGNYRYEGGCAGHERLSEIYLEFNCWSRICSKPLPLEVLFPNLPEEFIMEARQTMMDDYVVVRVFKPNDNLSPEEFQAERRRLLDKLLAWYQSLPPNCYDSMDDFFD